MDYGKSFTYIFEDDNWVGKFLIGVVISLVPIVQFAGYGYMLQVVKNVRDGEARPLPEWDEFGKFFVDGLKFIAGLLVYLIPVILLSFAMIPFAVAMDSTGSTGEVFGLFFILISCLLVIFSFLPALLYPALFIQLAKDDQISDMFRLGDIWQLIKSKSTDYIIVLLMVMFVLGFIASLGIIACFIGVFFTAWWAQLASAHLFGQLAKSKEKPAEAAAAF